MNRLTADSGSTKTDWIRTTDNGMNPAETKTYTGRGLNPHIIRVSEIEAEMMKVRDALGCDFDEIRFYGAGVGTPEMVKIMETSLGKVFECGDIQADSDMAGAAASILGKEKGIACIMGTGSNSCHYDGEKIDYRPVSLGYILDDTGGGVSFGKRLLADIFKRTAPEEIIRDFQKRYDLSVPEVLKHLYREPSANRWMAGFMPFVVENKTHPYISKMIDEQLEIFFDREFHCYSEKELKEEGIGYVGSVAYLLEDEIRSKMESRGWKMRGVVKKPLEGIINNDKR